MAVASYCNATKVYARVEPDNEEEMVLLERVGALDEERDMWAGEVEKHKVRDFPSFPLSFPVCFRREQSTAMVNDLREMRKR